MGCLDILKSTFGSRTADHARSAAPAAKRPLHTTTANMEPIFAIQERFRADRGLTKVLLVPNPNYKANGTKSYVYLMSRFGFETTKPGPYFQAKRAHQRGLAHGQTKAPVGGRLRFEHFLAKRTGEDGKTGEVTAEDVQNDSEYLCEVSIGTPPQKLLLDFDTGSADLWVFSSELGQSLQQGHTIFNPSQSSTFKKLPNETWEIEYGDGSTASGSCGSDNVTVGGLTIKNQTVELAEQVSQQFAQGKADGLLGLAYPKLNTVKDDGQPDPAQTPVANMIRQGDVPKDAQLFTSAFYSYRDANSPKSFYTFGYIDQDLVKASGQSIHWTNIDTSEGFWMFPSTSTTVAGQTVSQPGNTAIADTGTTLALVSDEVCEAIYNAIPGASYDSSQQGYTFPTSVQADQLPKVTVAVGDKQFEIQPEDLAFAPVGNGSWYGGIQSRGSNPFDIYGDVFLKSVYAIWDQGNNRYGLVPKIQKTQNMNPSAGTS